MIVPYLLLHLAVVGPRVRIARTATPDGARVYFRTATELIAIGGK